MAFAWKVINSEQVVWASVTISGDLGQTVRRVQSDLLDQVKMPTWGWEEKLPKIWLAEEKKEPVMQECERRDNMIERAN